MLVRHDKLVLAFTNPTQWSPHKLKVFVGEELGGGAETEICGLVAGLDSPPSPVGGGCLGIRGKNPPDSFQKNLIKTVAQFAS